MPSANTRASTNSSSTASHGASEKPVSRSSPCAGLLAAQAVYLPVYQDSVLGASTDRVIGVSLVGPPQIGVFGDAGKD